MTSNPFQRHCAPAIHSGPQGGVRQKSGRRGRLLLGQGHHARGPGPELFRRILLGQHPDPLAGGDDRNGRLRRAQRVGPRGRSPQRPAQGVHTRAAQIVHLLRVLAGHSTAMTEMHRGLPLIFLLRDRQTTGSNSEADRQAGMPVNVICWSSPHYVSLFLVLPEIYDNYFCFLVIAVFCSIKCWWWTIQRRGTRWIVLYCKIHIYIFWGEQCKANIHVEKMFWAG